MEFIGHFTSWPPYLPEGPRYKMNKRLVCPQSRCGNFGGKFCSLPDSNFGPAVPNHIKFGMWRIRSLLGCSYIVPSCCNTSPAWLLEMWSSVRFENCAVLVSWALCNDNSLPTTYRSHIQGSWMLKTLEDGTDRLSRNIGKELPLHAA